jgi:TonB family protein
MFWLALAAAAQAPASSPQPYTGETRALFRANDYPAGAFARGEQGTVVARLVIDPAGRVEACGIEQSSGSKELDSTTCEILRRRAKFRPVQGAGDEPLYQVFRTPPIVWSIGGPSPVPPPVPDVELDLSKAPPGITLPFDVSVSYIVGADGKVTGCKPSRPVTGAATALVAVACDPSNLPPTPAVRNNAGKLVDAMNHATLRFTLSK